MVGKGEDGWWTFASAWPLGQTGHRETGRHSVGPNLLSLQFLWHTKSHRKRLCLVHENAQLATLDLLHVKKLLGIEPDNGGIPLLEVLMLHNTSLTAMQPSSSVGACYSATCTTVISAVPSYSVSLSFMLAATYVYS